MSKHIKIGGAGSSTGGGGTGTGDIEGVTVSGGLTGGGDSGTINVSGATISAAAQTAAENAATALATASAAQTTADAKLAPNGNLLGTIGGVAIATVLAGAAAGATAVQPARTLTAGAGLTGGGDLSANRTINVEASDASITVAADGIAVSAAIQAGAAAGATALQPGGNLTGSINGTAVATVLAGAAAGATAVQPARTITAGAGLTGGGDLSANRTIDVAATDATIVVAADGIRVGEIANSNVAAAAAIAGSKIVPDFGAQDIATTGALSVGTGPALIGHLRIPHGGTIGGRNNAGSGDVTVLSFGTVGTNAVQIGDGSGSVRLNGSSGSVGLLVSGSWKLSVNVAAIGFDVNVAAFAGALSSPQLNQSASAAASATGQTLTLNAQDMTGTTAVTAGKLVVRAGNATGASGTRNGGDLVLLAGTGASANGNVSLVAEAANYQSMRAGLFVGNCSAVPTANPTNGGFLYVEAGALKWRGPSGAVTPIAAA